MDGQGAFYYSDGDREIGDYKEGIPIGVAAKLYKNGEVKPVKY